MKSGMPAIALLGDVMLGRGVAEDLVSTPPDELWAPPLRELLRSCDAVICNLECCISQRGSRTERIPRKPFFFRAPAAAVESLRAIGVTAVGLANNHALDFGPEALLDTIEHLHGAGIDAFGAGSDMVRARAGTIIDAGGTQLGIVAATDHPAEYAAGKGSPGVAHAGLERGAPRWLRDELDRLRQRGNLILAFLHWGPNKTVRPARWQRRLADELLDAGADAIVGHSSHLFHGVAFRPGGPALYDLGDALDDYAVDAMLRNDLGICAIWRPGSTPQIELIGLRLRFARTEIAAGGDAEWIADRLDHACRAFGTAVKRSGEAQFELSPG
jgi:poly-gamma-glutamate capsule biosynthesis protein CapA/YwtB (metallophosphatase superfamily)